MIQNLENEVWMPIKGYESIYEVSNMGRLKCLGRTWRSGNGKGLIKSSPERIMKGALSNGYVSVSIYKDGGQDRPRMHRLVAEAFIPNPENKTHINHKNGVRNDNRVENLEWCTPSENLNHAYEIGLTESIKRGLHHQAKRVKCDTLDVIFDCAKDAADFFGVGSWSVEKICRGKQRQTNGLTFRYL